LAAAGPPVDLALRMKQLPDRGWVDSLVHHQKLMPVSLSRLARFLAERHASLVGAATEQDSGRVEHFQGLVEEVCTQVRRHIDLTLSQAMFDLATLSITRFMEGHRKLFMRRQKKSRVVHCHGAFSPEHVFVHGRTMLAISPLEGSRRFRVLDAANDVATFVNGLLLLEASELAELFTKRYAAAAKDRDLLEILPAYQLFQALRCGQSLSEWLAEGSLGEQARPDIQSKARRVLALAVELARRLLPQ
jgi:aminoglycoside phosphotransferase family enzyme